MKMIRKLFSLSVLLCAIFTACSDLNDSSSSAQEGLVLSTGFSARSVALPSSLPAKENLVFGAYISWQENGVSHYVCSKGSQISDDTVPFLIEGDTSAGDGKLRFVYDYTKLASSDGCYKVSVYVFNKGKEIYQYSTSEAVACGTTTVAIGAKQQACSGAVVLGPVAGDGYGTVNGFVDLAFEWASGSTLAYADVSKIKVYKITTGADSKKSRTEVASVFNIAKNAPQITVKTGDAGVLPGVYEIELNLGYTTNGVPVTTKSSQKIHSINVYQGLTTDCWYNADGTALMNGSTPAALTIEYAAQKYFYVRGADYDSDNKTWFEDKGSAAGDDDNGDGSIARPFGTIQKAVDCSVKMNDGATEYTVYVDGKFTKSVSVEVEKKFTITIEGLNAEQSKWALVDVSSYITRKGFYFKSTTTDISVTLKNLKVTGGNLSSDNGAGIYFNGGSKDSILTLNNVEVYENNSKNGGGIYCNRNVRFEDEVYIHDNTASVEGGGVKYENGDNNKDGGCSLILGTSSSSTVKIYKNESSSFGGGISVSKGTVIVNACEIYENNSKNGGGIGLWAGKNDESVDSRSKLTINGGKFYKNQATDTGGAIFCTNSYTGNYFDITINGGTIGGSGVENTAISGAGFYHAKNDFSVKMSGSATIYDDFYLASGAYISVLDSMEKSGGVKVSLGANPLSVTSGSETAVLKSVSATEDGTAQALTWPVCNKFSISNDSGKYCVKPDGVDGKLAVKGMGVKVENANLGYDILISSNNNIAGLSNTAYFTVVNPEGKQLESNEVNSTYIKMIQNGDVFLSSSENSLVIPEWLPAGEYQIITQVLLKNGIAYDKYFSYTNIAAEALSSLNGAVPTGNVYCSSIEDFNALKVLVNGMNKLSGITVYLSKDVDFNNTDFPSIGSGTNSDSYPTFSGTFDGLGHTLKNVIVKSSMYSGMFANINNATIKNLTVTGSGVAGLVGMARGASRISNCVSEINITAYSEQGGGIVNYVAHRNVIIENCVNKGSVTINSNSSSNIFVGGIAGHLSGRAINCINYGNLKSNSRYSYVGGIGGNLYDGSIENCLSEGEIETPGYSGGIAGRSHNDSDAKKLLNNISYTKKQTGDYKKCGILGYIPTVVPSFENNFYFKTEDINISSYSVYHTDYTDDNFSSYGFDDSFQISSSKTTGSYTGTDMVKHLNSWIDTQSDSSIYKYWKYDEKTGKPVFVE